MHTLIPSPLAALRRALGTGIPVVLVLAVTASTAEARSSLTARFRAPVAGPGLEQQAELILDLFPGNGEAIIGAAVSFPQESVQVESAVCALGHAEVADGRVDLDYTGHPVGDRDTDTLTVVLRASTTGPIPVEATLSSNVDTLGEEAHRARVMLTVVPPLRLRASLSPPKTYAGEAVELVLSVTNEDDRAVEAVMVDWPAGLTAGAADPGPPIGAGATSEQAWQVRLEPDAAGSLPLVVRAESGGLRASPVAVGPLRVRPVPRFTAGAAAGEAVRGEPLRLRLVWSNPGSAAIPYHELVARASAGFEAREAAPDIPGGHVHLEDGAVEVRVLGPGELGAGQDRSVELDLTPTGTGPFAWSGWFRPPDREGSVDLGLSVVRVAAPESPRGGLPGEATDLELVDQGLAAELGSVLDDIPLSRGATVSLISAEEDEADWVVEGLLTRGLLSRGVRVLTDDGLYVLRYRVAAARVVYSSGGLSLGPLGGGQGREARAVVYLRLEDAGERVLWVHRLEGRIRDPAVSQPASWLSSGDGFPQTRIEPDHRYLELGLSGAIVGGLLFIFFAP